ncbi:hypothetical protein BKA82DRAFT_4021441 [Pisolithus tinctorius]|nr:hypothetical protein BKA82DRAFT_4021441 [Pisolithus tinctorius]
MPEWCPWKAAVQRVLGIPHPPNKDERKAGNSVINAKYTKGAACEIWVTQISSNSCQNGVHGKPLLSGCQGYLIRSIQMGGRLEILVRSGTGLGCPNQLRFMPEWCPWKAAVERVLRIPHPLNTDGWKAGNSLINGTYIQGAACEVWVTQISSDSCHNGVHGRLLFSECWGYHIRSIQMGGRLAILVRSGTGLGCPNQLRFMPEWCPWKAAVERVLRIPHPLNTDGRKAGNSLINGTYIQGEASTVEGVPGMPHPLNVDGRMAGNNIINAKYTKGAACELQFMPEWFPWKVTVEQVPGMLHPLNTDGRMAGNSLINAKYPKGAACDVWVTQISSNPCQNGVHGKPIFRGCWGCPIHSMWMGGWLAIVRLMPNTSRLQLVRSGSLKSSPIHASMVSIESRCSVGARDTTSISDGPVFMFQQGTSYWGWACPYAVII